ncbi:hypothetical protein RND71_042823 [Anisodus tanguticus]|uniref:Phytocyanin domain-containing protein n=1 Tax=Anisodus tanguticus TaxID=243964 RepID=A0AAE1USN1_9SOLA|nr:hypothetical protein RND71_042823 [Anisodus tanguticus]
MASTNFLIALFVVVVIAGPAMATDHLVGDDQDSNQGTIEYWTSDPIFTSINIFKYKKDAHNVYKADKEAFQSCTPSSDVTPLTSGNDEITLTSPGKKWYICGIGKHCEKGVKLAINVLAAESGSPAPSPSGPASSSSASWISPNEKFVAMIVSRLAPDYFTGITQTSWR